MKLPIDQLEQDHPLFTEVVSLQLRTFLNSPGGQDVLRIMRDNTPSVSTTNGVENAALAGAAGQGWRDALTFLERLCIYVNPPLN